MEPRRTGRRARAVTATLLACGALVIPTGARAEQPSSQIVAVYEVDRCADDPCRPGVDRPAARGATIDGPLQIHVASEATFGLEWVRLEAHLEGRPEQEWVCLQRWGLPPGTFEFSGSFTWDSTRWPDPPSESQCEEAATHFHGGLLVRNGRYELRAFARERSPQREKELDPPGFTVTLTNPPTPPAWAQDPQVDLDGDGLPSVQIRWQPSPEDATSPPREPQVSDIVEYRFVRIGPDGSQAEFAVNASNPAEQGCQRLSALYLCRDDAFAPRFGGDYRYALLAYRPGFGAGVPCATAGGTCIESALGEARTVTVPDDRRGGSSQPSPDPTASATSTPGDQTGIDTSAKDDQPLAVAPTRDRSEQLAAAGSDAGRSLPVAVAAVMILVLASVQLRRARGSRR